jgi:hypothetical protein
MWGLMLSVDHVTSWGRQSCRRAGLQTGILCFFSRAGWKAARRQDWRPHKILWFYYSRFGSFKRLKARQQTVAVRDLEQSPDPL